MCRIPFLLVAFLVAPPLSSTALAQQTTGIPGSPGATTTIDGKPLPAPDPAFGGVIKEDALQSKIWWAPRVVPPKQAPNILLILTDDSGFGVPSMFGDVIPTPAMDRVAKAGLRYNNIHSTALCSPKGPAPSPCHAPISCQKSQKTRLIPGRRIRTLDVDSR